MLPAGETRAARLQTMRARVHITSFFLVFWEVFQTLLPCPRDGGVVHQRINTFAVGDGGVIKRRLAALTDSGVHSVQTLPAGLWSVTSPCFFDSRRHNSTGPASHRPALGFETSPYRVTSKRINLSHSD